MKICVDNDPFSNVSMHINKFEDYLDISGSNLYKVRSDFKLIGVFEIKKGLKEGSSIMNKQFELVNSKFLQ